MTTRPGPGEAFFRGLGWGALIGALLWAVIIAVGMWLT